jgi:hypothetical protein
VVPFARPGDLYDEFDERDSFVTIGECAKILGVSEDRVVQLGQQGTLRTRDGLVQPALIPGYTT